MENIEIAHYERACDEIELALMGSTLDGHDRITALIEVLCRVCAEQDFVPDSRFFRRVEGHIPGRIATILADPGAVR